MVTAKKKRKVLLLSSSRNDWHVLQRRSQSMPNPKYTKCFTASVPTEANNYLYIYTLRGLGVGYEYTFMFSSSHLSSSRNHILSSPSLPVVTHIIWVAQRALLPPPHYGTCLRFYREKKSAPFFCLVDSRRIVPTRAAWRSQQ